MLIAHAFAKAVLAIQFADLSMPGTMCLWYSDPDFHCTLISGRPIESIKIATMTQLGISEGLTANRWYLIQSKIVKLCTEAKKCQKQCKS